MSRVRHPRSILVAETQIKVMGAAPKIIHEAELTPIETAGIFDELLAQQLKYALRMERHGNYSDPADLE